jgi:Rrf2 family nitric oxide-sensitive transcriptional repressor
MRLTKSTSHAIRILIDCARASEGLTKVATLSQHLGITQQNVFKIVNVLTKAGLVEAMRGRHGGVRLARPAESIRIGDVVRATEVTHVEIEEGAATAKRGRGHGVNRILDNALEAFIEVLDQHTIADMAQAKSQPPVPPAPERKPKSGARKASLTAVRARRMVSGSG